jgi:hypothetical protein
MKDTHVGMCMHETFSAARHVGARKKPTIELMNTPAARAHAYGSRILSAALDASIYLSLGYVDEF